MTARFSKTAHIEVDFGIVRSHTKDRHFTRRQSGQVKKKKTRKNIRFLKTGWGL